MSSVKELAETRCLTSIPSEYVLPSNSHDGIIVSEAEIIPTIDFSLLTSGTPDQRSKVVQELGYACREWGFFMLINHSLPKKVMDEMLKVSQSFFDLTEEEKSEYRGKQLFDPIKYGTSFNATLDKSLFWRDHLKVFVHPHFNAPSKPHCFRDISKEFCTGAKELAEELLKGISMSLGLEENYVHEEMDLDMGSQLLVVNCYPPCPQPEVAMGLPPHSDHGLLTLLIQNGLGGLQVMHNAKWVPINPLPQSLIVNIGDHMEILSNGIYKSVIHRAVVNNKATRISIGTAIGPALDKIVRPASVLVDRESRPSAYHGIKYKDYVELQYSHQLNSKSCLDLIRI